ncbi:energy transducer TonB [Flavobacterium sp. 17A]|uniref:Energy transducer TonB n=1 Tax=Flavobacterium potami TaxID=2872310 RepID=A0A9X1HBQ2_9FLAO|nr:energy transducer TonB [Flavobacterium potami]MBZ4036176.1 energy transducer TonB [Flavobacterium potami]
MKKHKITIPEPCQENWDKMTPNENGRFCLSCSKTVVDFTTMLPEEIQHFFIQNENEKVCGRFRKSQLDSIVIQIPSKVLYSQTNYRKIFLLALFVAMGTTLLSCQNKDGRKQKIEKVEITNDTSKLDSNIRKALINKNDSTCNIPPPPPPPSKLHGNDNPEKYKKMVSGEIVLEDQKEPAQAPKTTKKDKKLSTNVKEDESQYLIGAVMQTNAEFPGGIEQFYNFFAKEFNTPENIYTKNLKIRVSFAVEKDGSMSYMQSEPTIDQALEQEIIRVFKICPKWQPGQLSGKKIRMQYSLPITF